MPLTLFGELVFSLVFGVLPDNSFGLRVVANVLPEANQHDSNVLGAYNAITRN